MYRITDDRDYGMIRERQTGPRNQQKKNPAKLLSYVGNGPEGKDAKKIKAALTGHIETEQKITDELLGYNAAKGLVLIRVEDNSREFDIFVNMPFTKGVTDKETGRTMLITGDYTHHGEAMQGQFECDLYPYNNMQEKGFGNIIRWINVGKGKQGFLGLDYNPGADSRKGMAQSVYEVQNLCKALADFGMHPEKYVRLLEVPHIKESKEGRILRVEHKLETLDDWVEANLEQIQPFITVGGRRR